MPSYEIFSLRLEPELKRQVEDEAYANRTSINKMIVRMITEWLESESTAEKEEMYEPNAK